MDHLNYILSESKTSLDTKELETVQAVDKKLSSAYKNKVRGFFGGIRLSVRPGGSSNGVKSAFSGTTDVGMASRNLKAKEDSMKDSLKVINIGSDALVFVVAESNPNNEATKDTLSKAFTGAITQWSQFGKGSGAITLLGKGKHHGTYDVFLKELGLKNKTIAKLSIFETEAVIVKTIKTRFNKGLAFTSLGALPKNEINSSVKLLSVDAVSPLVNGQFNDKYKLVRPLNLVVNKGTTISGKYAKFFSFLESEDGQKLIEAHGFVPNKFDKFW